jgi:Putative adhesin
VTSAMPSDPRPAGSGPANPGPPGMRVAGFPVGSQPRASRLVITPARRAAILIGVPIVFLVFITGGYSVVSNTGRASFPVSESVPLPNGTLTMNLDGGSATLAGSSAQSSTARLAGTIDYQLSKPTLRVGAGDISLSCPGLDQGNCSLNASVDVPAGTALTVATGGGNLSASDLSGGATLSADGGNITLTRATGVISLSSGGGDVGVSHISGPAVSIGADGGNITGGTVSAAKLTADSGGGDVTLTLTSTPGQLTVNSDGGNVTIMVPPGKYIVDENAGGGNVSGFSSTAGAVNTISVSSGGGDISLSQS